jgi:hypothetical protein
MQNEVNFGLPHRVTRRAKKEHPHGYLVVSVLNHYFDSIFRATRSLRAGRPRSQQIT